MPFHQRTLHRTIFRTSHKILLDRLLANIFKDITGDVLVLGAGMEPYRKLLPLASSLQITDVAVFNDDIDQVMDAHSISYSDSSFDCILAIEVFEHLENPALATAEIYRSLKEGGTLIMSVPFMFHIHGDPHDYQRFTAYGLEVMFTKFSAKSLIPFGSRLHVISDIITTSWKPFALFRVFNWLLGYMPFSLASEDCPSGYLVILQK